MYAPSCIRHPLWQHIDIVLTLSQWCLNHAFTHLHWYLQQPGWPSFAISCLHLASSYPVFQHFKFCGRSFLALAHRLDAGSSLSGWCSAHNWQHSPSFVPINCEGLTSLTSALAFTAIDPPSLCTSTPNGTTSLASMLAPCLCVSIPEWSTSLTSPSAFTAVWWWCLTPVF